MRGLRLFKKILDPDAHEFGAPVVVPSYHRAAGAKIDGHIALSYILHRIARPNTKFHELLRRLAPSLPYPLALVAKLRHIKHRQAAGLVVNSSQPSL